MTEPAPDAAVPVERADVLRALQEAVGGDSIDARRARDLVDALITERDFLRGEVVNLLDYTNDLETEVGRLRAERRTT